MRSLIRGALSLIGMGVVAYVWFFIPLGRRTMHEHALRIADTAPAHELGEEAVDATRRIADHVGSEWTERYAPDASLP
jgi:hypothetical protein